MVVSSMIARAGLIGVAALGLIGSNPALANSSANADISAPLRSTQTTRPATTANSDDEFQNLFSSWQRIDSGKPAIAPVATTAAPARSEGTVAIPSRMPVEGVRLTSSYGMRVHPVLGGRRAHKGVDLAAPTGTPVYAPSDGTVSKAEWFSSYGLYISLEHGGEIQTRYGHLSRLNVYAGQQVHKGDLIGYVGSTGRSTGPHLHYEVRIAGAAVNPIPYMQADEFQHAIDPNSTETGQGEGD